MSLDFALKKILPSTGSDLEHFVSSFGTDLLLTLAIAYSGANAEYLGYAIAGSSKASPVWLIKKLTYSGSDVTDVQFANGTATFSSIWNNRTSLSYS